MNKHVLTIKDFGGREGVAQLCTLADAVKEHPERYEDVLKRKKICKLFYQPSTRTSGSFESAVLGLGGNVMGSENAGVFSSAVKGESLEDTIITWNVMGADAIVIRHPEDDSAHRAAAVSEVPIINAGSGTAHHPTQALLDLYTLKESKGKIDGLELAVLGDLKHGRTIHSLVEMLAWYDNIKIWGCAPKGLEMPQKYIEDMKDNGIEYTQCKNLHDIPYEVGAIYTTRIQREYFDAVGIDESKYSIDKEMLDNFSEDTIVMHPLPRNNELSTDVDADPRAKYFRQMRNGVYTRKSILMHALSPNQQPENMLDSVFSRR